MSTQIGTFGQTHIGGNGVAIGVGNSVRNENHYYQGPGSGGTKGPSRGDALPAASLVAFVMLAVVAFYFTREAPAVYFVIGASLLVSLTLALTCTGAALFYDVAPSAVRRGMATATSAALAIALLGYGWTNYPLELTELARQAASAREFWCGLSPLARAFGLQHALLASACALVSLLLAPQAWVTYMDTVEHRGGVVAGWWRSWGHPASFALVVLLLAAAGALFEWGNPVMTTYADSADLFCPR